MKPSFADPEIVREAVRAFYEATKFRVCHPKHIGPLLKEDFFSLGTTPNMGTRSSLMVRVDLDPNATDPEELSNQFAPLLQTGQLSPPLQLVPLPDDPTPRREIFSY